MLQLRIAGQLYTIGSKTEAGFAKKPPDIRRGLMPIRDTFELRNHPHPSPLPEYRERGHSAATVVHPDVDAAFSSTLR
jgi:hypothetical protein